ncbi:DUF2867 domain-containing protein [Actinokineospora sp. 24-640]
MVSYWTAGSPSEAREFAVSSRAGRIVCLNSLDGPSVAAELGSRGAEVVEVRAAVVAAGRPEFEAVRSRGERWPVASRRLVRPLASAEVERVLREAAGWAAGEYVVGGPEVLTYAEYVRRYARVRGLRRWVLGWGRSGSGAALACGEVQVDEAIRGALDDQRDGLAVLGLGSGAGVYTLRTEVAARGSRLELAGLGGSLRWYGLAWAWRLRIVVGWFFGEQLRLQRPAVLARGAAVDWWTVVDVGESHLVLYTDRWFTGEAWLAYRVEGGRLEQVGALRSRGLLGWLYWWAVYPIHLVVFGVMARKQARRTHDHAPTPSESSD